MNLVVYTAIFSDYDLLARPIHDHGTRYVCFADRLSKLPKYEWEVINIGPQADSVAKVRELKMTPHLLFPDACQSIWIDGSFRLKFPPSRIASDARGKDFYLNSHHWRNCILQEAAECVKLGRAGPVIFDQAQSYVDAGHPEHWGLYCGGFMYRKHTDKVRQFNEDWWREFSLWHARGSSRDQISLQPCLRKSGIDFASFNKAMRGWYSVLRRHNVILPQRREAERLCKIK